MQPGMDPGAFAVVLRLRELVRGIPIATQAVPDRAQHGRRKRRRLLTLEAVDEHIDRVGHYALTPTTRLLRPSSYSADWSKPAHSQSTDRSATRENSLGRPLPSLPNCVLPLIRSERNT